jgi:hypothetical protein
LRQSKTAFLGGKHPGRAAATPAARTH